MYPVSSVGVTHRQDLGPKAVVNELCEVDTGVDRGLAHPDPESAF